MRVIVPPIKSQGIKTKLVPWIKDLTAVADQKGKWIEPFGGTGVVAFNSGYKNAILNGINPHIINFYKAVQQKEITPFTMKAYLEREGKRFKPSRKQRVRLLLGNSIALQQR